MVKILIKMKTRSHKREGLDHCLPLCDWCKDWTYILWSDEHQLNEWAIWRHKWWPTEPRVLSTWILSVFSFYRYWGRLRGDCTTRAACLRSPVLGDRQTHGKRKQSLHSTTTTEWNGEEGEKVRCFCRWEQIFHNRQRMKWEWKWKGQERFLNERCVLEMEKE